MHILAEGYFKIVILQSVDHTDPFQQVGLSALKLLVEQEMRQDGRPLIIGALELVLELCEITVLDWVRVRWRIMNMLQT